MNVRQCRWRSRGGPVRHGGLCRLAGTRRPHLLRRPHGRRADDGTTLVELLVSSILLTVVLATVALAVNGMVRAAGRLEAAALAGDDARAVTDALTRGLAGARLVNPPAAVNDDVYLEAVSAVPGGGGAQRCRQWRVRPATGDVQTRSWNQGATTATAWTTLARGVVDLAGRPPFTVLGADGDWVHARVVVDVRFQRLGGPAVAASTVVPLVNGVGADGGLADDLVCTEAGRS
jgi:type II secretory pathway pseudopilin PulG